jgi:hypothetical protein
MQYRDRVGTPCPESRASSATSPQQVAIANVTSLRYRSHTATPLACYPFELCVDCQVTCRETSLFSGTSEAPPLLRRFEKLLSNASRKFIGGYELCQFRQCRYIERPGFLRSVREGSQLRSPLPAPFVTQYCAWYLSLVLAPPFSIGGSLSHPPNDPSYRPSPTVTVSLESNRVSLPRVIHPDLSSESQAVSKRESACSAIGEEFPVTAHGVQKLPAPSCRFAEVAC